MNIVYKTGIFLGIVEKELDEPILEIKSDFVSNIKASKKYWMKLRV